VATDATWASFVATASRRVLDPSSQPAGVAVIDTAGCELRGLEEVETGQQIYVLPAVHTDAVRHSGPVPSPVTAEEEEAEEKKATSASSPVEFGSRPSLRVKSLRGKRLLSVRVTDPKNAGLDFTLQLYSQDENPADNAREFCAVFGVSSADCEGLVHIMIHAKKSVRAYLYTGVKTLPKEQQKANPWESERPKYPSPKQGRECSPPMEQGGGQGASREWDHPQTMRPKPTNPRLEAERMARRVAEFSETMREDGPKVFRSPLTKFQYGHFHRCTACEQQNAFDESMLHREGVPLPFGVEKQTLMDDYAIDGVCGIERLVGEAGKKGIVLSPTEKWEGGSFGAYFSVHRDGLRHGRRPWNMWYASWNKGQAYAESDDGIKWHKPSLPTDLSLGIEGGVATRRRPVTIWNNNKGVKFREESFVIPNRSNFVGSFGAAFTVAIEPMQSIHNASSPEGGGEGGGYVAGFECQTLYVKVLQWIAAVGLVPDTSQTYIAKWADVCAAHSKDGLRWTLVDGHGGGGVIQDADAILTGPGDSYVQIRRLAGLGHVLATRHDFAVGDPKESAFKWRGARGNRVLVNPDFKNSPANWSEASVWYLDMDGLEEHLRRQVYSHTVTEYLGVHIGLFSVLEWPKDGSESGKYGNTPPRSPLDQDPIGIEQDADRLQLYVGTSRDGIHFDLSNIYGGKVLIPPGKPGEFDSKCLMHAAEVVTYDDSHWLYYEGCPELHEMRKDHGTCRIGLAKFRIDSILHLRSSSTRGEWGSIRTKPFRLDGSRLILNVKADMAAGEGKGGEVQVAVLDSEGHPVDGFGAGSSRVEGNGIRSRVTWDGNELANLTGRTVRLIFFLKRASLFAFQVQP